jgi:hypothetical protein
VIREKSGVAAIVLLPFASKLDFRHVPSEGKLNDVAGIGFNITLSTDSTSKLLTSLCPGVGT